MTRQDDLRQWKEDNEGVSFAEWLKLHRTIEIDNTIEQQDRTLTPINRDLKEPIFEKKRTWRDYRVKKNLYLSKWVYEKLKNQESISDKVNNILLNYFSNEPKQEEDKTE